VGGLVCTSPAACGCPLGAANPVRLRQSSRRSSWSRGRSRVHLAGKPAPARSGRQIPFAWANARSPSSSSRGRSRVHLAGSLPPPGCGGSARLLWGAADGLERPVDGLRGVRPGGGRSGRRLGAVGHRIST
jgi:hypothetical protein